jgi:hypothetical protein
MFLEVDMKNLILAATTLVLAAGAPLAAQNAHLGVAVNLGVPTGAFSSTTYSDASQESYDPGLGFQFTASFPVDRSLAFRLNLGGNTFRGKYDQPGNYRQDVQDAMFSVGGEAQIFLADGNAMRHLGSYFIGGMALDLEKFSASDSGYDPSFFPNTVVNKSRLAVVAGFGHSFPYAGRWRWTLEAVYHKTLTSYDTNAGDPPPADFVRISAGFVF